MNMIRNKILFGFTLILCSTLASAQKKKSVNPADLMKSEATHSIDSNYSQYKKIALEIWNNAELGYKEKKSTALLQ
jgi:aminobenzoyl-glutamate utilization protein B